MAKGHATDCPSIGDQSIEVALNNGVNGRDGFSIMIPVGWMSVRPKVRPLLRRGASNSKVILGKGVRAEWGGSGLGHMRARWKVFRYRGCGQFLQDLVAWINFVFITLIHVVLCVVGTSGSTALTLFKFLSTLLFQSLPTADLNSNHRSTNICDFV